MKKGISVLLFLVLSMFAFAAGESEAAEVTEITLWTTEEQPERIAVQEDIAADFRSETGITVEVVPVSETILGERATAAFASGELPDIIYAPLANVLNWAEEGIADSSSATEVVRNLGESNLCTWCVVAGRGQWRICRSAC